MFLSKYQKDPFMVGQGVKGIKSKNIIAVANPNKLDPNSVKFSSLISPDPSAKEIKFLNQLGVDYVYTWIVPKQANVKFLKKLRKKLNKAGITLWSVGMLHVGKSKDIILNTKKRAERIKEFKDFLKVLKKSGIDITIFTWEPSGVSSSSHNKVRGGAEGRCCDVEVLKTLPLRHGRIYTEKELWKNMKYFLDTMLPVAEKLGIKLALHPNDPPTEALIGGIPNLIRTKKDFDKVYRLGKQSPSLKMEFCCGCWLEGATPMGNLLTNIKEFIKRDKIIKIHLRNVSAPLPQFTEMFIDDGYGDIFEIVRTVVDAGYKGTIILDHSPEIIGGTGMETAYCAGYIKGLIRAAQAMKTGKRASDLTYCLGTKCQRGTLAIKAKSKISKRSKKIKKSKSKSTSRSKGSKGKRSKRSKRSKK